MLQIHALRPCGLQKQTRSITFPFWTDRRCRNEGEIPCLECSPSSTLLPQSHHCPGTEPFLLHLGICPSHSWGTSLPRTVHRCCLEREKKKIPKYFVLMAPEKFSLQVETVQGLCTITLRFPSRNLQIKIQPQLWAQHSNVPFWC